MLKKKKKKINTKLINPQLKLKFDYFQFPDGFL